MLNFTHIKLRLLAASYVVLASKYGLNFSKGPFIFAIQYWSLIKVFYDERKNHSYASHARQNEQQST